MKNISKTNLAVIVLSIYICFVFIQSLFFKFTYAPETQHIFNTLDAWASTTFGIEGLFVPPGPFNAYVIGSAELVASLFLLSALLLKKPLFTFVGALLSFGIISGAISFHLFTPLGINVQGDGGTLFGLAVGVWMSSVILLFLKKESALSLLKE